MYEDEIKTFQIKLSFTTSIYIYKIKSSKGVPGKLSQYKESTRMKVEGSKPELGALELGLKGLESLLVQ